MTYSYVAFGLNLESKGKIHGLEASPAIGPGVKRLVPSSNPRRIPALCALLKADAARFARTVATCLLDGSE